MKRLTAFGMVWFLLAGGLALAADAALPKAQDIYLKSFDKDGKVRFEFADHMKDARFWWPSTLLTYSIRCDASVKPEALVLRDLATNAEIPFQWTPGDKPGRATVSFLSDLPSGASRKFELAPGAPKKFEPLVKSAADGENLVFDTGRIKVRVPAGAASSSGRKVPAPILAVSRGGEWLGDSWVVSDNRPVKSMKAETVENGPLFIARRVTYQFEGGGTYIATVRAIAGYDFIEFNEEIQGLKKEDGVYLENAWKNFHPTHRQSINSNDTGGLHRVDEPIIAAFRGEDPKFTGNSRVEEPEKEYLFRMVPNWPNGWGGMREVGFWDEKGGDALALVILDTAKWQDHEYAIWSSSDILSPRFRFAGGVLYWKWPLINGTRLTGVAAFDQKKTYSSASEEASDSSDENAGAKTSEEKPQGKLGAPGMEYPRFLRNRFSELSLNRVKDWVMEYPDSVKHGAVPEETPGKKQRSLDEFMKDLSKCSISLLANGMSHPVVMRDLSAWVYADYSRLLKSMTPEQREKATAWMLLTGYMAAQEEFSPVRTMIGGHPNFMSDYKFPLLGVPFLFPDHPMAPEWRDQYVKFLELTGYFYTRPNVPAWEAKGGRWTENIGTYNWAFLTPMSHANRLGIATDGVNRFATPGIALMGNYLVGILTSPQFMDRPSSATAKENAAPAKGKPAKGKPAPTPAASPTPAPTTNWESDPKRLEPPKGSRIHPPQGAHSGKRGIPASMYNTGEDLLRYSPLTGEYMMWGAQPFAKPEGGRALNCGTNPRLTSAKFTGYGIVMRAAVDTPDEVSVFLQQVDKGPNYRWGYANQNGSGDIYYYAQGKSFSGHGFEDTGDRHVSDATLSCNTGVYKTWGYRCIGMNELTEPFYNLEVAQFAELLPAKGPDAYSWPEYKSRSVMMMGSDYIITFDAIEGTPATRFCWATANNIDEEPNIIHLRGGNRTAELVSEEGHGRDGLDHSIHAKWWDPPKGGSDRMMLVSHKKNVSVVPQKVAKGTKPDPYVQVQTPTSTDYVFEDSTTITYSKQGMVFDGTAGVIRNRADGNVEMALFHGAKIGNKDLVVTVSDPKLGFGLSYAKTPREIQGTYFGRDGGTVKLEWPAGAPAGAVFHIDGVKSDSKTDGKTLIATLPAGEHRWELTARPVEPMPPVMLRTENKSGGAKVFFATVQSAQKYRMELSADGGAAWKPVGETTNGEFNLTGLKDEAKVHVRAVALNGGRESRPAKEYPIYATAKAPLPPDGIQARLPSGINPAQSSPAFPRITWGEVLGVTEYRLYRREMGKGEFKEVYRGLKTEYTDKNVTAAPAFREPGIAANIIRADLDKIPVYEYAVSAVNGNGEGDRCIPANTDPAGFRNWYPEVELRFKRQSAFWLPPYVMPAETPPPYYPQ